MKVILRGDLKKIIDYQYTNEEPSIKFYSKIENLLHQNSFEVGWADLTEENMPEDNTHVVVKYNNILGEEKIETSRKLGDFWYPKRNRPGIEYHNQKPDQILILPEEE